MRAIPLNSLAFDKKVKMRPLENKRSTEYQ